MRVAIVCKSIHHGNTRKVTEAMAEVLKAKVMEPEEAGKLDHDMVGFGSGIYAWKHHRSLFKLVEKLPDQKGRKAFIFSTSGGGRVLGKGGHRKLRKTLEDKGFKVVGEFNCRGWDTFGPLKLAGGINKGRPDENDLENARKFAKEL